LILDKLTSKCRSLEEEEGGCSNEGSKTASGLRRRSRTKRDKELACLEGFISTEQLLDARGGQARKLEAIEKCVLP
jgi:hypothetical protein